MTTPKTDKLGWYTTGAGTVAEHSGGGGGYRNRRLEKDSI